MNFSLIGFHGFSELLNLHPVFVHFPIVLFPLSFIFYLLALKWRKQELPAHIILLLALTTGAATVISGRLAADSVPHNEIIHQLIKTHESLAYIILALGAVLSLWSFFKKEGLPRIYPAFLGLFAALCLGLFLNADLGGRMVFVHGAGVKIAIPLIEAGHQHHHASPEEDSQHPPKSEPDEHPSSDSGEPHEHHHHDHHEEE